MISTISCTTYNLATTGNAYGRVERENTILAIEDTVCLVGPDSPAEMGNLGFGFVEAGIALLVSLAGEAALALAKKIAQETGRALAEVVVEMIALLRTKPSEDNNPKMVAGFCILGPTSNPRTLAILQ